MSACLLTLGQIVPPPGGSPLYCFQVYPAALRLFERCGVPNGARYSPLLQFTLLELWRRREGTRLTWAAYNAIGGVRGGIAKRAEAFLTAPDLDDAKRSDPRRVLGRLVQLGDGTVDTRRRAPRSELAQLPHFWDRSADISIGYPSRE